MIIIGSYHKTEVSSFRYLSHNYQPKTKDYMDYNHFDYVTNDMIKNTKCVVIIRHPYEIIM